MVIDSSALIAILSNEAESGEFAAAIEADPIRLISAASLLETAIVIEARHGLAGGIKLDELVEIAQISIVSVSAEQITLARMAFREFGKGRHVAGLNFGDCFSFALAKLHGEALLFKGNDFSQTDIRAVV